MMKVALVTGSAGDGHCGVGDYAYELAQYLALDAEVHLYYAKGFGPQQPPYPRLTTLHLHELGGYSLLTIYGLIRELREGNYDIVHLQYPSKGFGMAGGPLLLPRSLAGMNSNSLIVLTLHEYSTSHQLRKGAVGEMLPHINALVLTNEQELAGFAGKLERRALSVMPVGNVLRSQAELEAVWLAATGEPVPELPPPSGPAGRVPYSLFHYGLPAPGKGFSRLLEALKLVREAGRPARLFLGGDFPAGSKFSEEVLGLITEYEVADAVVRLGHIPREHLEREAEQYLLGVFPFDEGYSSKRSSIAAISHCDLPLAVGGGSSEEHPYFAPDSNTGAALAVLLTELFTGKLAQVWEEQVIKQRAYATRFSFARIAAGHVQLYRELLQGGVKLEL
jgi:glycosyltransferase involved in cell wall biosynthesis